MNLNVWGPLLFATMLFIISASVKIIAFKNHNVWLEVAPELALWAVGIFFSLSISEELILGGKTVRTVSKKASGRGLEIDYVPVLPDNVEFSPKYIYLLIYGIMIWVLTTLLSGQAIEIFDQVEWWDYRVCALNACGIVLSGTAVGAAVRALLEASK